MRVPFGWLREFIDPGISVEKAAHLLTMSGLEVEALETEGADVVMVINVTPNRADCLSVLGVARELSVLTGAPLVLPQAGLRPSGRSPSETPGGGAAGIAVEIRNTELCRRYAGRVIKNVKTGPGPEWMAKRLEACGLRPINNIVDVTNYVLLELGHPLHAFDLDTLKGGRIVVDTAEMIYRNIKTLDGVERKLPASALVIADAQEPVALAGIMGGANTEVEDSTRDIFLEAAWFEPRNIRKTARALGLSSESSYRFERGTDIGIIPFALDRASFLMEELSGGVPAGAVDVYPVKHAAPSITVRTERIKRILGAEIEEDRMRLILSSLGFAAETSNGAITASPPSYRLDVEGEADIIEEVARIHGYGNIPSVLPSSILSAEGAGARQDFIRLVSGGLRKSGYDEAVNFSFMNPGALEKLALPHDDIRRSAVVLLNPLNQEESLLRTTIIPSLIENFRHNREHGLGNVKLAEIAKTFIREKEGQLPSESLKAAGIAGLERAHSLWRESAEDFYLAKGAVEALLDELGIKDRRFEPSKEPFLHPGKSADLIAGATKCGYVGVLSPAVAENFEIRDRQELTLFELDLDILFGLLPPPPVYKQVPKFPGIERDLAIVVDDGMKAADIIGYIKNYPSELIENAFVFDLYKGEKVPDGKKSMAFNIRYRAAGRTLTEEEIEAVHAGLIKDLLVHTGGQLRT